MHRAAVLFWLATVALAQSTASLSGRVLDPRGEAVAEARVRLEYALGGFQRETLSQPGGGFGFANLPLQSYTLTVEKPGFAPANRTVALRSNVPLALEVRLELAQHTENVEVTAFARAALLDPEATGTRSALNASSIERMPVAPGARGLESVLLSFPGFAADANGAIHPRGAHNQMQYVIDGMPVTDQLTGAFGSSIDPNIVQTIELYTGNIPAEFGGKISGVAQITTKSGMGSGRRFSGSLETSAAQFDTLSEVAQLAGGSERGGYFISLEGLKNHRFLDQVSLDNLHNGGNAQRSFTRLDWQASPRDVLRLSVLGGRSSFELANLRSQQAAGQSQRQLLRDLSGSLGWVRTLNPRTTLDATASYRTSIAQLFPSAGDKPVTAAQARRLSTLTLAGRFNRIQQGHTLRAGGDYQRFPVSEHFSFGITSPEFHDLEAHDLRRGGRRFEFSKKAAGSLASGFLQDQWRWRRLTFSAGLRYDRYRFLVEGHQLQPRLGMALHLSETGTVLRASYNRVYQTPVNENLLLSNSEEAGALVTRAVRERLGGALIRIRPERQNVYEAGLQQALGAHASLNAVFYYKDERDLHDNDNFLNTGIIFPTSLARSRVRGAELRFLLLPVRGFSASVSATHYHVVVTPPFTGGLFLGNPALELLSAGPFVIDHDQTLGLHSNIQYTFPRRVWASASLRHDSGLVTNPSDPAQVAADPDYADLLPLVRLDSAPPRVRSRSLVDLAAGYERVADGRKRWGLQFQISNLTGRTALYNFQSIFVGTRLVQPRTVGARLRWYF